MDKKSCDNLADLLHDLYREFEGRFQDITSLGDEFRIFSLRFSVPVNDAAPELQMVLHDLQANTLLKQTFHDVALPDVYRFLYDASFPALRKQAARVIAMSGSTYLCEHLFSLLKVNKKVSSPVRDD